MTVLDGSYSASSSKTDASRTATRTEAECREDALDFIGDLRECVPMVLRDHPTPKVTEQAFKPDGSLGKSTPKIVKYLMKVSPFVVKLEAHFTPYFDGESPVTILETVKSELTNSDRIQETRRASLPVSTRVIYQRAGEVLEMIEDMNRIAKLAFKRRPEVLNQFNKDLIERASRPTKKSEPAAEAV